MSDWVVRLIDGGGYWGIFVLMVLENVFPPIPSELIMGIGGIRAGQGRMEILPLLLAGTAGTTIGNCFWYGLGRALGFRKLKPLVDMFGRLLTLEWRHVRLLNVLFRKYGQSIVFVFRFMPVFRTMVSLPAGLFRMGAVRFLLWTAAGALIWNVLLVAGGWYLGNRIARIVEWLGPVSSAVFFLAFVGYVWRLATWRPGTR